MKNKILIIMIYTEKRPAPITHSLGEENKNILKNLSHFYSWSLLYSKCYVQTLLATSSNCLVIKGTEIFMVLTMV
jgi:hypothetical protein